MGAGAARRLVALSAAGLALCALQPAAAVPSVDRVAAATASLRLAASGGVTFNVDVLARVSEVGIDQGVGRIEVTVRRCVRATCDAGTTFVARLLPSELQLSDDLAVGRVETALFGFPLTIDLAAADDETSTDGKLELYQPVLPTGQVRAWVRQTRLSKATAQLMGRTCKARAASVYREEIVDGVATERASALPAQLPAGLSGLRGARCA